MKIFNNIINMKWAYLLSGILLVFFLQVKAYPDFSIAKFVAKQENNSVDRDRTTISISNSANIKSYAERSSTLTIQENETGFVSVDGSIDNNNSGFSGSGFANTDNANGKGINWEICIPESGSYSLVWRFANGSSTNRTAQILVNGSTVLSNQDFPGTGSWTTWTNTSESVISLPSGTCNIRLEATNSSGLPNIDYIAITGTDPQPGNCQNTISVTGVSISPSTSTIDIGNTLQLSATISPSNATNKNVTWSSSNSSVAEVNSSGLVSGISAGSATITVTTQDGNYTSDAFITVNAVNIPVTSVSVSPTSASINVGATTQLTSAVSPSNASNKDVNWTTSNSLVATVNSNGLVTGIAEGTALITVTTVDGNIKAECTVTVSINTETSITIQENATGFCGVDGSINNNNAGFTGDGFANTDNASGKGIDWKASFSASETYTFTWQYANGSDDRPGKLLINGSEAVSNINFNSTGNWTSWNEVSVDVSVSEGINDIRLESTGSSGLANIDYLKISGSNPQPASCLSPALSVNPNILSFGDIVTGSSSTLSYILNGSNLSGNVTINAPNSFTISTTNNGTYNSSIILTPSNGAISQTVYVKFIPSEIKSYSGNITNTTVGASSIDVEVSGSGVDVIPPSLSVNPASITFGNVLVNNSKELSYTITGSNLTPSTGNISISASSSFDLSSTSGSGYSSSISIPYSNGEITQQIYVRFTPTAEQTYSGSISNSGGGASTQNVAVSGTGVLVLNDRHRVIVSTDIGGSDNDDFQSMVHFLVYADVLDVEGLVSSPWEDGRAKHILEVIDEYEIDYPNLVTYSSDYPEPDELRAITKQGATDITPSPGYSSSTEGSEWIIECARRPDPRPLYILVWGCLDDVPQALHDAPDIESKLRVYWIGGPNKKYSTEVYAYLKENFPNLWIIEANTTYRGMFNGGDMSGDLSNTTFVSDHVRNHGALGDFFYSKKSSLKAGDTPSVLYVLNNNVEDPSLPGWGGAFVKMDGHPNWWTDNPDPAYEDSGYDGAKTVNIWREEFLRDFQARMDRCQTPKTGAVKRTKDSESANQSSSSFAVKNIYPNPVNSLLNFEFSKKPSEQITIYLLDITGKPVISTQISDIHHTVDMSELPKGLYFIKLTGMNLNKSTYITKY